MKANFLKLVLVSIQFNKLDDEMFDNLHTLDENYSKYSEAVEWCGYFQHGNGKQKLLPPFALASRTN
jgi:hypothetical protein